MKLSINSNAKTEMASTKGVYRKSNRNKREIKPVDITSPSIKDFFQLKNSDRHFDESLTNDFKSEISSEFEITNGAAKMENSVKTLEQRVSPSINTSNLSEDILISSCFDDSKHQSPSKPVTPHRIVCLSPEKKKTESVDETELIDNIRSVRNKKRYKCSKNFSIVLEFCTMYFTDLI